MDKYILQQLYVNYGKEILLYLYSLCKSWDMAEDLMQETFEKALLSLSDSHTNMRAWLYLVARNLCFNAMKREKRHISIEDFEGYGVQNDSKKEMEAIGIWGRSVSNYSRNNVKSNIRNNIRNNVREDILEELITKEQNRLLYHALMQIPSPKREVLQLQYFGGLTLKEIARILQISPENARVLSCRAKKELKLKLEEEGYEI